MITLYLLPYSDEIRYSFDRSILEEASKTVKNLVSSHVLEIDIDEQLAENLKEAPEVSNPYAYDIPSSFYEKEKNFLKNPPSWFEEDGMRIYIIFDKQKRCYWCPSGNNLNSFYERNPENYLSKALRVELDANSYINLNGYFKFRCDNF